MLEAGDGGGGISKRSAVSLLFPLALVFATLLVVPLLFEARKIQNEKLPLNNSVGHFYSFRFGFIYDNLLFTPFSTKSFKSLDVKLLGGIELLAIFVGDTVMILKRHISVKSHAEFNNWPTFGTPFEMVNPMAPG